jgi:hypothetical protein
VPEVAEALGVSANSVSNATSVAVGKLRFALGQDSRRVSSGEGLSAPLSEDRLLVRIGEAADWLCRGIQAERRARSSETGR